jgi:ParB family chromosome partitioning protein
MPKRASLNDRIDSPEPATQSAASRSLWGDERPQQQVVEIDMHLIMPNRRQPRTNFAASNLEELAQSIRVHGVIQPVIVRPIPLVKYEGHGRTYELIAGERRWRASQMAGKTTIPALVRSATTDLRGMIELSLIENMQRQDLHPLDEAVAFQLMQEELSYSYTQIAERVGLSKAYIQNRMRLLQLDDDLRALVAERPDTIKHVYELARVTDRAKRAPLIAAVRDEDLSRTVTRARVNQVLDPQPDPKSVSQETDRAIHHKPEGTTTTTESVSQETDRAIHHKPEGTTTTTESVSQETDRAIHHKPEGTTTTTESVSQETDRAIHHKESDEDTQVLTQDLQAVRVVLKRWEATVPRLGVEQRTLLLQHIDELSHHLEAIVKRLV